MMIKEFIKRKIQNTIIEAVGDNKSLMSNVRGANGRTKETITQLAEILFQQKKIPYKDGERIRIVFLFQVASFWPSWESFYQACIDDQMFDVRFLFLDETNTEQAQMKTARSFLDSSDISYIPFESFDISAFAPHVLVMQTPYDHGHRLPAHSSTIWKEKGYRIAYIPYGIEISDTLESRKMHFEQDVIRNAWRIYTFNEEMVKDYRKYCANAEAVRAIGLPKFDSFSDKQKFPLSEELTSRIGDRKVLLWKVHFPKFFLDSDNKLQMVTPRIQEYIDFADYLKNVSDIFVFFMPHPKFMEIESSEEKKEMKKDIIALLEKLRSLSNVYIDLNDDYRYSLVNADYIIVDRSAVMVEAAAVDVPVLYMYGDAMQEPMTNAIAPIINSYCQGSTCDDMISFLTNCLNGIDEHKYERANAIRNAYPFLDGKSGERIKNDLVTSLKNECENNTHEYESFQLSFEEKEYNKITSYKYSNKDIEYMKGICFDPRYDMRLYPNQLLGRIEAITGICQGKRIIHVGCCDHISEIPKKISEGTWLQKVLDDKCKYVLGIDINSEAVEYCNEHKLTREPVLCCDITKCIIPNASDIDFVVIPEIIEHVNNPVAFLTNLHSNLKSQGFSGGYVITAPNALGVISRKVFSKSIERINTDHRYWFSPYTLGKVMVESGITPKTCQFVQYAKPEETRTTVYSDAILVVGQ